MNIFEEMCKGIADFPEKRKGTSELGVEYEYKITPREKYLGHVEIAERAIRDSTSSLEKVHNKWFDLSKKEKDLQEQAMGILAHYKFFRLPLIQKVVIMCRGTPELRKVQAEMSGLSKEEEDLRDQHDQILDYRNLIFPPFLPHELKTQEI